jgi:hypothetical protein
LRVVGLIVGILLVIAHGIAIAKSADARAWLKSFPRSKSIGTVLLAIDAIWAFLLIANMDLGEFTYLRNKLLIVIVVATGLAWKFVDEFLAVRALGMLLLLAAEPVLEAAFLRPETSRLLFVVLAYAWAVIGMFWVGMPYVLRDQIGWVSRTDARWRTACGAGIVYGASVLVSAALLRS